MKIEPVRGWVAPLEMQPDGELVIYAERKHEDEVPAVLHFLTPESIEEMREEVEECCASLCCGETMGDAIQVVYTAGAILTALGIAEE